MKRRTALKAIAGCVASVSVMSGGTAPTGWTLSNDTFTVNGVIPDSAHLGGTNWAQKTPKEILADINYALELCSELVGPFTLEQLRGDL